MKYLCLVYGTEADMQAMSDEECVAYNDELRHDGRWHASEALQPVATAVTVRVRDGNVSVTDGPFAETKEQLGGFYVLDCADLDEAIDWARRIPVDPPGSIEIRPVLDYDAAAAGDDPAAGA